MNEHAVTLQAWRTRNSSSPLLWLLALMLAACSHDAPTHAVAPAPAREAGASKIVVAENGPARSLDDSCSADTDCEVKNVGNCCGMMPACVNRAFAPDPAQVQAQCAKEGRAGICGFQELSGCQCVDSRCVGLPAAGGGDVR